MVVDANVPVCQHWGVTIDERLERLTERHEALTQTVEIIAHQIEALAGRVDALAGRVDSLVTVAERDGENIRALARIADLHDRRITRLEGGEQR